MSIASFVEAFNKATIVHPFNPMLRVWELSVCFELGMSSSHIHLHFIQALFKGQRHGSAGLDWLVALAQEHDVLLDGTVQRTGRDGLSQSALRAWYARHGFTVRRSGYIELPPCKRVTK